MAEAVFLPIDYVDKDDHVIGSGPMEEAWSTGAIHRIAVIFVRRPSDNALLLQKRSIKMETAPGLWDFSAAGHVDSGESYEQASVRELYEEIGLKSVPQLLGKYFDDYTNKEGKKLNRFYAVFLLESEAFPPQLQTDEVDGAAWFSRQELHDLHIKVPDTFTRSLFMALGKFPQI